MLLPTALFISEALLYSVGKINTELKLARITIISPKVQQHRDKELACSGVVSVRICP